MILAASNLKIAVVGAGVIGVTSAYELAAAGHEVTVFDSGGTIAGEASFAPAGMDGPGWAMAWSALAAAAPGWPALGVGVHPLRWLWAARWLNAHRRSALPLLHQRTHRLAAYSRERAQELRRSLNLEFENAAGVLVLSRSAAHTKGMLKAALMLEQLGVAHRRLAGDECLGIEPGLNSEQRPDAAIHLSGEGTGNCREFTHLMRQHAERLGVRFVFHTKVTGITAGERPVLTLRRTPPASSASGSSREPDHPEEQAAFDAVAVCSAIGAKPLLAGCGLRLPLARLLGHSVTLPLRLEDMSASSIGPTSAVIDAGKRISITRSGSRVRVAAVTRLGGQASANDRSAVAPLYRLLDHWFPGCARASQAQHWAGACSALPNGLPLIGASGVRGVWLNIGHGDTGWAMACGSAKVLSDSICGRSPGIDIEGLGIERLRS
jgi:D-amino-acid dehydrogenase